MPVDALSGMSYAEAITLPACFLLFLLVFFSSLFQCFSLALFSACLMECVLHNLSFLESFFFMKDKGFLLGRLHMMAEGKHLTNEDWQILPADWGKENKHMGLRVCVCVCVCVFITANAVLSTGASCSRILPSPARPQQQWHLSVWTDSTGHERKSFTYCAPCHLVVIQVTLLFTCVAFLLCDTQCHFTPRARHTNALKGSR